MKPLILVALLLTGCAYTRLADPTTGKTVLFTQANAQSFAYTGRGVSLTVIGLDHSTPTTAGGAAFAQGANAVGAAGTGLVLAAGSSGLFTKGVATGKSLILPTAAVASHVAAKPSVPKATPRVTDPNKIWPVTSP